MFPRQEKRARMVQFEMHSFLHLPVESESPAVEGKRNSSTEKKKRGGGGGGGWSVNGGGHWQLLVVVPVGLT